MSLQQTTEENNRQESYRLPGMNGIELHACERVAFEHENRPLKAELRRQEEGDPLIGRSAKMQAVMQLVEKVAPTNSSILILGESGTGKEVVTRTLHKMSLRATKPFIAVNCAALSESLLENELFGHEKGAFTGATERTSGLFESADGGTLLLDEMADMPPALQAKLLRVLDQGEFSRVGSIKTLKTDVRVLSTTNKDLRQRIAQGLFREDLFYRLHVVTIELPSLRERREDIPLLVHHFLERATRRRGGEVKVTEEALAVLMSYAWPGNVRELANVIERAVILCSDDRITPYDLSISHPAHGGEAWRQGGERPSLEEVERAYIAKVLHEEKGNKTKAAKALGISLRNLYRKIEDYHIAVQALRTPSGGNAFTPEH